MLSKGGDENHKNFKANSDKSRNLKLKQVIGDASGVDKKTTSASLINKTENKTKPKTKK